MKNVTLIIATITALALSACASTAAPTAIPTIILDNSNTPSNDQSGSGNSISASAIIVPISEARLSFTSVGRVTVVNVEVGDNVKAGDILVELDTTLLEAKVKEAEANLEAAQAQVRFLKRLKTDQVHLEKADAEVERIQALLDSANAMLAAQSTLIAPFDGTVVNVDIAPAETVAPGQIVIVLGDLSSFQIETTDLSERDVTKIQKEQSATIFIEALNSEFTGTVADVSLVSSTLGGDVVYTVTLDFDQQPDGLRWGMSADVRFDE